MPGPWGTDHVTTTPLYNKDGEQIGFRNETHTDHLLHPGIVERRIVKFKGQYHVLTDAGGAGRYGYPNIKLDEFVWGDVDKQVMHGFESND